MACRPLIVVAGEVLGCADGRGTFVIADGCDAGARDMGIAGGSICGANVEMGTSGAAESETVEVRMSFLDGGSLPR